MRHLFAIFAISLATSVAYGQSSTHKSEEQTSKKDISYLIKLNLLSPIVRTAIVSFEKPLSNQSSLHLSGLYQDQSSAVSNAAYLSRFAATAEYRYYMSKTAAPVGFYVGSFLRYQWMKSEDWLWNYYTDPLGNSITTYAYQTRELSTIGAGLSFGYQHIFKDRIAIDLYLGPAYNSGDKRIDPNSPYNSRPNDAFKPYVGYFLRSGFSVGLAF
jgi:hypothetical protein